MFFIDVDVVDYEYNPMRINCQNIVSIERYNSNSNNSGGVFIRMNSLVYFKDQGVVSGLIYNVKNPIEELHGMINALSDRQNEAMDNLVNKKPWWKK